MGEGYLNKWDNNKDVEWGNIKVGEGIQRHNWGYKQDTLHSIHAWKCNKTFYAGQLFYARKL